MKSPQQEEAFLSSPESNISSPPSHRILSSTYLTVPSTRPSGPVQSLPGPNTFEQDYFDTPLFSDERSVSEPILQVLKPSHESTPTTSYTLPSSPARQNPLSERVYMSVYSSSSVDTEQSEYSNPPARRYRVPNFQKMSRKITSAEKDQYTHALRTHQINTLVELRRIEKAFAVLGTPDVSEPMTAAWSYYVDSHGLLTELRCLTRNYPFSPHCLDEAKSRVFMDPASNRSWNLCWLVLSKIQNDQLIPYYARYQASQPSMWAGHTPTSDQITQLTDAFVAEWSYALSQMLRHWEQPPTR